MSLVSRISNAFKNPDGTWDTTRMNGSGGRVSEDKFEKWVTRAGQLGSAYNNFQMEKALLEEQRDRTSVETGVYVPGPQDVSYAPPDGEGFQIGGMSIPPMYLALGAVALLIAVS